MTNAVVLATLLATGAAWAEAPQTDAWAVVVGSNRPGPGQAPLQFAEVDAARVADVFVELGDIPEGQVLRLVDPTPEEIVQAIDKVSDGLAAREAAHRRVLFYYSGHARSGGLDLGPSVLPLSELKDRLEALPASVRVVVLDACQSGAAASPKGLEPAASFSIASVQGLQAQGTVVIASSAADELSQESDDMQGSYFTHHFVVGLRGAADGDDNGWVTVDEAYRYAYDRTVVSTAGTRIGRQHPSLMTKLAGEGALTLTRPAQATARIRFGEEDAGAILLVRADTGTVVAEVDKVAGDALTLALAPGRYSVRWQLDEDHVRCQQELLANQVTRFHPTDCQTVPRTATLAKGGDESTTYETVFAEVGIGEFLDAGPSPFTDRLGDFGYAPDGAPLRVRPTVQVSVTMHDNIALLGAVSTLDSQRWTRLASPTMGEMQYRFNSWRAGLGARLKLPLADDWVVPYGQGTAGPTYVMDRLRDPPAVSNDSGGYSESYLGAFGAVAGGVQLMPRIGRFRGLGVFGQVEQSWAFGLRNLFGDQHRLGGMQWTVGVRGGA